MTSWLDSYGFTIRQSLYVFFLSYYNFDISIHEYTCSMILFILVLRDKYLIDNYFESKSSGQMKQ